MIVEASSLDSRQAYFLMTSCVVPRPIAWVSTRGEGGVANAAPFSYFQALSSAPPTIVISAGLRREGDPKDTRANILATGEFVVNVVSEPSAARMVESSRPFPAGVSEFAEVGFAEAQARHVAAPRIAEAAVSMECRHVRTIEIGKSGVLFGEIVCWHLRDDVCLPDGTVDPWRLAPLGRMGGKCYAPLREVVEIEPDGTMRTRDSELLDLWARARAATIERVRAMAPDALDPERSRRLVLLARSTERLAAAGEPEGEPEGDERWTPARLADALERDRDRFLEAAPRHLPHDRETLKTLILEEPAP